MNATATPADLVAAMNPRNVAVTAECDNEWHRSAPARAEILCPECVTPAERYYLKTVAMVASWTSEADTPADLHDRAMMIIEGRAHQANADRRPEPKVGMGCSIVLVTDTVAAVIVKVNAKSIVIRRVETGEARRTNHEAEPFPVIACDGILDRPIGSPERYSRVETEDGPAFRNGSVRVRVGRSVSITDYRY